MKQNLRTSLWQDPRSAPLKVVLMFHMLLIGLNLVEATSWNTNELDVDGPEVI
jgi:hypothetical protein